ncbi:4-(cytidine 5'-diphospho)-2-C-methyl-D-erythritol kinase [Nocardioides donggukensis]|uniref:4-diphosphocytidyl-2-C-methyl-D-erythritol kinase n=1 Tax=Nocardioides donggukensis TaxID=2774019 RepID=A0A927K7Z1_9ACTN|nr:4-(cytidine 5'-diphospho)-2-C-methyl-D-erythritol kinase [Nocardioides donggukensis]MBD8870668.1 4-(cytidine 5'-diphospho)-2-C-methyl-D-erythritol kinase [Nocardioides donggukensis]
MTARSAGSSVSVRAPAKINLHLGVGPVRPDGYHPLATAYQAISLFSTVTATEADGWSLTCSGRDGVVVDDVPLDDTNLAMRAARLLAGHAGRDRPGDPGVALHLDKGIPVAGGLAGGSADAAAALLACDALWGLGTPLSELLALAGRLGSDVPFGLLGGSAAGHGRGELVTALADAGRYDWVVLTRDAGMSTPAVYAEYDALHAGSVVPDPEIPAALVDALAAGSVRDLAAAVGNDLQPASLRLRPELGAPLEAGLAASALAALVSGSGPTCLFLCEDGPHAEQVAAALAPYGRTVLAHGPVPGAEVI